MAQHLFIQTQASQASNSEDNNLMRSVKNEDNQDAFSQLYERNRQWVFHRCMTILGNPEDAEDAMQEIFSEVWKQRKDWRGRYFRKWFNYIVRNRAVNFRRDRNRKKNYRGAVSLDDPDSTLQITADNQVTGVIIGEETESRIENAINKVLLTKTSVRERLAWNLRYREGYSVSDVARIMGLTRDQAETSARRCTARMKPFLADTDLVCELV